MSDSCNAPSYWKLTALTLGVSIAAASALAANMIQVEALMRHEQERNACLNGQSNQDRATCLREATASYAEAKRGLLDDGPVDYAVNALKRCEPLPEEDRRACHARMHGLGTSSGSVEEGGILRELVTIEVEVPTAARP